MVHVTVITVRIRFAIVIIMVYIVLSPYYLLGVKAILIKLWGICHEITRRRWANASIKGKRQGDEKPHTAREP